MSKLWWFSVREFEREAQLVDRERLEVMHAWAEEHEHLSDRPGTGRNPRARKQFCQMKQIAERALDD
jgi:hypothetical protein